MEKERFLLGMTKSFLDLKGNRSRSLELDFLRLVYVNSSYTENIFKAILAVMNNEIVEKINKNWISKYEAKKFENSLVIISYENILDKNEYSELKKNIQEQIEKNRKGNVEDSNDEDAVAFASKELENKLTAYILEKYKEFGLGISSKNIMDIRWDACYRLNPNIKNKKLQENLENHIAEIVEEYNPGKFYIPLIEEISTLEKEPTYIGVPGMYGGFSLWKQSIGDEIIINSSSWCRISEGSGKRFRISEKDCILIEKGFVWLSNGA